MNYSYHSYNYKEDNDCYTWLQESRDWRKHIHNDLESHDKHLTLEAQDIRKNTDEAENSILNEVREVVVNKYLSPLKSETNDIKSKVNENNNILMSIWNKLKFWDIK